ncbi:MAG: hypothetical protein O2960_28370, partial [Verrucomicrobia bacterium]|nr:hypothetical protein [Verrucomicrobiota bacterium]
MPLVSDFGSFRILKKKVGSSLLHRPTCVLGILATHWPRAFEDLLPLRSLLVGGALPGGLPDAL